MTRKPSPIQRVGSAGLLPKQFPKIPDEFVRKFKELEPWQRELGEWWYGAVSVLQADMAEIRQRLNAAENEIATLKTQLPQP